MKQKHWSDYYINEFTQIMGDPRLTIGSYREWFQSRANDLAISYQELLNSLIDLEPYQGELEGVLLENGKVLETQFLQVVDMSEEIDLVTDDALVIINSLGDQLLLSELSEQLVGQAQSLQVVTDGLLSLEDSLTNDITSASISLNSAYAKYYTDLSKSAKMLTNSISSIIREFGFDAVTSMNGILDLVARPDLITAIDGDDLESKQMSTSSEEEMEPGIHIFDPSGLANETAIAAWVNSTFNIPPLNFSTAFTTTWDITRASRKVLFSLTKVLLNATNSLLSWVHRKGYDVLTGEVFDVNNKTYRDFVNVPVSYGSVPISTFAINMQSQLGVPLTFMEMVDEYGELSLPFGSFIFRKFEGMVHYWLLMNPVHVDIPLASNNMEFAMVKSTNNVVYPNLFDYYDRLLNSSFKSSSFKRYDGRKWIEGPQRMMNAYISLLWARNNNIEFPSSGEPDIVDVDHCLLYKLAGLQLCSYGHPDWNPETFHLRFNFNPIATIGLDRAGMVDNSPELALNRNSSLSDLANILFDLDLGGESVRRFNGLSNMKSNYDVVSAINQKVLAADQIRESTIDLHLEALEGEPEDYSEAEKISFSALQSMTPDDINLLGKLYVVEEIRITPMTRWTEYWKSPEPGGATIGDYCSNPGEIMSTNEQVSDFQPRVTLLGDQSSFDVDIGTQKFEDVDPLVYPAGTILRRTSQVQQIRWANAPGYSTSPGHVLPNTPCSPLGAEAVSSNGVDWGEGLMYRNLVCIITQPTVYQYGLVLHSNETGVYKTAICESFGEDVTVISKTYYRVVLTQAPPYDPVFDSFLPLIILQSTFAYQSREALEDLYPDIEMSWISYSKTKRAVDFKYTLTDIDGLVDHLRGVIRLGAIIVAAVVVVGVGFVALRRAALIASAAKHGAWVQLSQDPSNPVLLKAYRKAAKKSRLVSSLTPGVITGAAFGSIFGGSDLNISDVAKLIKN